MVDEKAIEQEIRRLNAIRVRDAITIDKALAKAELLSDIGAIDFDDYVDMKDRLEALREGGPDRGYSVPMAADALGITDRTVRQWIRDGKIKALKISGTRRWLIDASEIERLNGKNN